MAKPIGLIKRLFQPKIELGIGSKTGTAAE
jgi:hypothetical protein